MFDSISREGSLSPITGFTSLLASMFIHAAVVGLLVVLPLVFIKGLPPEPLAYVWNPPSMPVFKIPSRSHPLPGKPAGQVSRGAAIFKTSIPLEGMRTPREIPRGIPAPSDEMPLFTGMPGSIGDSIEFGGPVADSGIGWPVVIPDPPPLPEPPKKPAPVRVGTLEPSMLIRRIEPVYPELARIAHISGTVRLQAVIDEEGNVTNVTVLSGHQVLWPAAVDAVKQWKYTPTVQNGELVPILAVINVIFKLR
jgi:protein TonB